MTHLNKIDGYKEEMIKTLQELLKFKSVVNYGEKGTPYGVEVQKSLDFMLNLGKENGFSTLNTDQKGGHLEIGQGDEIVGVLVHLDVVPEGTGWDHDPYAGVVEDGKIYGRGTIDDKGPAIAAYYAMKSLQGEKLNKRIRLIFGLDEESGNWDSIGHYLEKAGKPDFGFTPDADFPVIHAEMGIMVFELIKEMNVAEQNLSSEKEVSNLQNDNLKNQENSSNLKNKQDQENLKKHINPQDLKNGKIILQDIVGGNAHNMVADYCKATILCHNHDQIKEKINEFADLTGYSIIGTSTAEADKLSTDNAANGENNFFEITATGISAHGATPEKGLNAISIMMEFLGKLDFSDQNVNEFVNFYNECIAFDLNGVKLGCCLEDEISGKLIFNVGTIKLNKDKISLTVNARYPVSFQCEDVYNLLKDKEKKCNIKVVKQHDKRPINLSIDAPLVKTLMEVYRKHTGDTESKPIVIAGGTYARAIDNCVAYGPVFPNQQSSEHQKNEYIEIESMLKATKIYAEALYELAK